jgi:hypothetical protein
MRRVIVPENTRDRFTAGEPVAKDAAAVLAAEPIGLIPMHDPQRRRFVDLHLADGINRHFGPHYLKSKSSICGSSSKRRNPNSCKKRGDVQ